MRGGTVEARQLKEWRCTCCGRLLAKVGPGSTVEVVCRTCRAPRRLEAPVSDGLRIPGSRVII